MTSNTSFISRPWVRVILWICVVSLAVLIFCFSAQDSKESTETSNRVVRVVVRLTHPEFESLPIARQRSLWETISFYVRKSAHFLEYTALGFFLRLLMASYELRLGTLWAWLSGALYAATDELHQLLTGTRSGMWQDVLLDSAGVLFGVLAALAVTILTRFAAKRRTAAR